MSIGVSAASYIMSKRALCLSMTSSLASEAIADVIDGGASIRRGKSLLASWFVQHT